MDSTNFTTIRGKEDGEIFEKIIHTLTGYLFLKRKIRICKQCGNEFYPKRAKHDICYNCFNNKKRLNNSSYSLTVKSE